MQTHVLLAVDRISQRQQGIDQTEEQTRKLFGAGRHWQTNPAFGKALASSNIVSIITIPNGDSMIKRINQIARAGFQQAEVVEHLAVVESMRFEQQLNLIRMPMHRMRTTARAATAHDMGILKFE